MKDKSKIQFRAGAVRNYELTNTLNVSNFNT